MNKVLITANAHPLLGERLEKKGYKVTYLPQVTYAELEEGIKEVEGLVVTTRMPIDKRLLDKAVRLKWIGRLGSGMELIDETYANEKGIHCISTPEGNRNAVAEHTLALVLNLMNNISRSFAEVKEGLWRRNENRGVELSGKKVGIIGYGNTGSSFARLLSSFEVTVLAYDKYKSGFGTHLVKEASLAELFAESEVISLHLPLTAETYHFADAQFFSFLKKRPYFISTCRGKATHLPSLIYALKEGLIRGAGLDVLQNENPASFTKEEKEEFQFLITHPDVVITPHIAGYSHESFHRMAEVLLQKLEAVLSL